MLCWRLHKENIWTRNWKPTYWVSADWSFRLCIYISVNSCDSHCTPAVIGRGISHWVVSHLFFSGYLFTQFFLVFSLESSGWVGNICRCEPVKPIETFYVILSRTNKLDLTSQGFSSGCSSFLPSKDMQVRLTAASDFPTCANVSVKVCSPVIDCWPVPDVFPAFPHILSPNRENPV